MNKKTKKNSLYRKLMKKQLSFAKRVSSNMDPFDKLQLNLLLKYIERFVIVMFDGTPPEEYRKVLDQLRTAVPIGQINDNILLGTTPPNIGNAIYNTAFATGQMSLSQSAELKTIVSSILDLFEQYRQVTPPAINLDSSSPSPAKSTLSEESSASSSPLPATSTLSKESSASSTNLISK